MPSVALEQPRFVCALGAQQTVLGIPGAVPIVHAGPGCASKINDALTEQAGFQGGGAFGGAAIPSTNASDTEVVFGGEEKLRSTIDGSLKVMAADLFVVLTGCTSDIVGDDVDRVVSEFRSQGHPVVNAETGGFKGNVYYGHEAVLEAIVRQLLCSEFGTPNEAIQENLINVFSVIPFQNVYWRGDLEIIKDLLEMLGFSVNILFGYGAQGLAEWRTLPTARLNLVLSPWVGLKIASLLEESFGTPFFHWPALPIGAVESSRFLRAFGEFAQVPKTKVEEVIKAEETRFYEYLSAATDYFTQARNTLPQLFHLVADANYGLAVSQFLVNQMGFTPGQVILTDNPPEYLRPSIMSYFSLLDGPSVEPIFEEDGGRIGQILTKALAEEPGALVLGSTWEKPIAKDYQSYLLRLSLPIWDRLVINRSYLGYSGGLRLLEDINQIVLEGGY
jgi:nitrogenase molybdenum-iron protein beta chain